MFLVLAALALSVGPVQAPGDERVYPRRHELVLPGGSIAFRAPAEARPEALREARAKVAAILRDVRPDVLGRLAQSRPVVIVIPFRTRLTDLPEFADLKGGRDPHGQPYDRTRGCFRTHPALPRPVLAVGEEDVLNLMPKVNSTLHHELGHAVHGLGLDAKQRRAWRLIYEEARSRELFGKKYAGVSPEEFFAELSEVHFDRAPFLASPEQLARICPLGYAYLRAVYRGGRAGEAAPGSGGNPR